MRRARARASSQFLGPRGAHLARREEDAYPLYVSDEQLYVGDEQLYVSDEQRSQMGWIGGQKREVILARTLGSFPTK